MAASYGAPLPLASAAPDAAAAFVREATLARAAEASGIGVHSGKPARLRLVPAPPGAGIVFARVDLPGAPEIPAQRERVKREMLRRMTVIAAPEGPAMVCMVEHLLACCAGFGISNLRVELDGPECPIFDGSGLEYARLIAGAGLDVSDRPRRRFRIARPVALIKDRAEIVAIPAERTRYTFFAEFRHAGMPDEQATFEPGAGDFASEVAPARTFCFWQDVEALRAAGLIKGGSLENAIVLKDGGPIQMREGAVVPAEYRLKNELARHKLFDLMGDLSLLGGPVLALVSARASGHALHHEFAELLAKELLDV